MNGVVVNHLYLPKWANSPEHFVFLHRQALESDFASAHIHEWIDLIFGFRQLGREAVKAHNVFYYLTYEDAVDMDTVEDEVTKKGMRRSRKRFLFFFIFFFFCNSDGSADCKLWPMPGAAL
jgi:hypothetical protein